LIISFFHGMVTLEEDAHAEEKPLPNSIVTRGAERTLSARCKVYVALFSGRPRQDDSFGSPRFR
jgi:hypothetical protein